MGGFKGTCNYCKKEGHRVADCYKLKNKNAREQANVTNENNNEHYEQVLATIDTKEYEVACRAVVPNNIFLCDSGASRHMTNDLQSMVNFRDVNTSVQIGDGKVLFGSKEGDMKVKTKKSDGTLLNVTLKNLLYVPDLKCNLLLVGKLRERGTVIYDKDGAHIILQDKSKINFKSMIGQVYSVWNSNVILLISRRRSRKP
jgi:hypothetical protein